MLSFASSTRYLWLLVLLVGGSVVASSTEADPGFTTIESHHSVESTIERLQHLLEGHDVAIFARIDFSSDAAKAGIGLRPESLLVFGNSKTGTSLMQAAPTAGLDLPFKALIWEDCDHRVWIAYNEPRYIVSRHGLPSEAASILSPLLNLIVQAAKT